MNNQTNRAEELLSVVESAVLAAANHLLNAAESGARLRATVKEDSTLVLNLDVECQEIILQTLGSRLPVVAEEDPDSHARIESSRDYFLIDPIDGTTSCKRFLTEVGGQVGFGPLVGVVVDGRLSLSCFYNVPRRTLYTAVRGRGTYMLKMDAPSSRTPVLLEERRRLFVREIPPILESAALFFPGKAGEVTLIEALRTNNLLENVYRFGGFANDSARLAEGTEQIQVQFSVKPWDYSAVLMPLCAGYSAIFDPFGKRLCFDDWKILPNNPVIVGSPTALQKIMAFVDR